MKLSLSFYLDTDCGSRIGGTIKPSDDDSDGSGYTAPCLGGIRWVTGKTPTATLRALVSDFNGSPGYQIVRAGFVVRANQAARIEL